MSIRLMIAAASLGLLATTPAQATWWKWQPKAPSHGSSGGSGGWQGGSGGYGGSTGGSQGGTSGGGAKPVPAPAGIGLFALGLAGITIGRRGFRKR